MTIKQFVHF